MGKKIARFLVWLGVLLLQVISTQVVTFLVWLAMPDMENFPTTRPVLFVLLIGLTYTAGVLGVGLLAIRWGWLRLPLRALARLAGTLLGAYLSLLAALLLYHPLQAGNPFFFLAILTCIAGFYLGGWIPAPVRKPA